MRNNWVHLITIPLLVAVCLGWAADDYTWRRQSNEYWRLYQEARREAALWHCKFDLIDPIRAEAEVPLSEECKEIIHGGFK